MKLVRYESAGQVAIPTNRQVIHVVPRGFWIEGEPVSDPVGMWGGRLDSEVHIVSGAVSAIQNLTKCVEGAGVQVDQPVQCRLGGGRAGMVQGGLDQRRHMARVQVGEPERLAAISHEAHLGEGLGLLGQDLGAQGDHRDVARERVLL